MSAGSVVRYGDMARLSHRRSLPITLASPTLLHRAGARASRTTARRRSALLVAAVLLLVASMSACRPKSAGEGAATSAPAGAAQAAEPVRVELEADPAVGVVPVAVYVLAGSEGVSGATVRVTGDMTHAGMAPVEADAVEIEAGLYRAPDFAFSMAGDWVVSADVRYPDGRRIVAEVQVRVPAR